MKEMDITWRRKQIIGTIKFDEELVINMLKLGQPIGLCPTIKVYKDKEGNIEKIEITKFSFCPIDKTIGLKL